MRTLDGLPEGPGFDPTELGSDIRTIAWYRERWLKAYEDGRASLGPRLAEVQGRLALAQQLLADVALGFGSPDELRARARAFMRLRPGP